MNVRKSSIKIKKKKKEEEIIKLHFPYPKEGNRSIPSSK